MANNASQMPTNSTLFGHATGNVQLFNQTNTIVGLNISNSRDILPCQYLQQHVAISIAVFGIIGNLVTFLTILLSELRKHFLNQYLLVLLLSDTELLLKIIIERLFHPNQISYWACFFSQYLWNTPIYVSNFTILLLTMERFFAIFSPCGHLKYLHTGRWRLISAMLFIALLANFNLIFVLANNPDNYISKDRCIYWSRKYAKPFFYMPRIFFTFLLPLFVVIVVNVLIAFKLRRSSSIQNNPAKPTVSGQTRSLHKMLFLIPAFYVLLNLPYNLYISMTTFVDPSFKSHCLHLLTLDLFFLNHSINFALYAMASKVFRRTLIRTWIHPLCKLKQVKIQEKQNNSTVETSL